jgi:5-methylcytosine-specific restriction endonuclease McrA
MIATVQRYQAKHPERIKARRKAYQQTEHGKAMKRMRQQVRMARERDQDGGFRQEHWEVVLAEFGQRCAYCRCDEKMTIDHLTPIVLGGFHSPGNVVPACKRCNCRKHARSPEAWARKSGVDIEAIRDLAISAFLPRVFALAC